MVNSIYQRNPEIREAKGKIPSWLLAEHLGIHENTMNRWLRSELPEEKKKLVMKAIAELKETMEKKND